MISRSVLSLISLATLACAQDFYNGQPGPRTTQLDTYLTRANGATSGMLVPKLFTKHILVAAPFQVTKNEKGVRIENKGVNVGYIRRPDRHKISFIGALGLFKDRNEKYYVLSPQLYATQEVGRWSLDLEGSLSHHFQSNVNGYHGGGALGYGINDRVRVGGAADYNTGSRPDYRAIARIELTKDHRYWLQFYAGRRSLGTRLVINR
jgi:hypothetical protein